MSSPTSKPSKHGWRLECSYAQLPKQFYTRVDPTPAREPKLVLFNRPLARSLGLDPEALESREGAAIFAGNEAPDGSEPIAQAYAGHQFGHFTTLGDGRAHLLGEQLTPTEDRFDIQLKGSGRTPFSRGGDGRAALGPMLREYIISEAMHALGIPTTRSLAVTTTGETVRREEALPGAVLTRVAASHIRVGTFEWAAAQDDTEVLRALADYTLRRHYPDLEDSSSPYVALLEAIMERQAALIPKWLHVGFIHGVMNTDNMALSGETIDYGPCAFMDTYSPATVFSSIDQRGRYAYGNQPSIALWNLSRLAETMLPLFDPDTEKAVGLANGVLARFEGRLQFHWLKGMRAKLGLFTQEEEDSGLMQGLLDWMEKQQADFTNTFRALSVRDAQSEAPNEDAAFRHWHADWKNRLARQPQTADEVAERMQISNPSIIPRNHKVEEALTAAVSANNLKPTQGLLSVLAHPYDYSQERPEYVEPPAPSERVYQTFCGT